MRHLLVDSERVRSPRLAAQREYIRRLHNWVYEAARAADGVCGVRLYVDKNNHIAQETYSSLGMSKANYDLYEIDFAPP